MKSYLKNVNKRWIHVSTPPLMAIAMFGEEKAKELYNAKGTYYAGSVRDQDTSTSLESGDI